MAKHAFIAAPLLGTLIFLISIIVVINMQKAETAAVAETVSDAYHNKLVSMVEIYRSDLGSLFNIGLQRNIEYALTSKCWTNLIPISTERKIPIGDFRDSVNYRGTTIYDDSEPNGVFDEKEQRMFHCARTSQLMKEVVCTTNTDYLFGLPSWASIITNKTNFEGITLEAANQDDFLDFIGSTAHYSGEPNSTGTGLCQQLLSGVELDCKYFADPESFGGSIDAPFRCCSQFDSNANCIESSVVPGACDDGEQFLMRVAVQNDEVYRKFPRVLARDSSGNQIRAGAITDVDYDAPITYPFFKYLDLAYKFNKYVAFGKDRIDSRVLPGLETGASRGILEGSCVGGELCKTKLNMPGSGIYLPEAADDTTALNTYARSFFDGPLKDACDETKLKNIGTNFSINDVPVSCEEIQTRFADASSRNIFNINSQSEAGKFIAYSQTLNSLKIVFVDLDTTTQVRPDASNEFCWYSSSAFETT